MNTKKNFPFISLMFDQAGRPRLQQKGLEAKPLMLALAAVFSHHLAPRLPRLFVIPTRHS